MKKILKLVCKKCAKEIEKDESKSTKNWKALKNECNCGSKEMKWIFIRE